MISWMDGFLLLLCVLGFAGMWLYFFIKEAEEYSGAARIVAFGLRKAIMLIVALAIMAFGGFMVYGFGSHAWEDIQIVTRGVEAFGDVLQTTSYQTAQGRRFNRHVVERYSTTLRLTSECGVETASVDAGFRLYEGIRIELYCVPGTGIVALYRKIDRSDYPLLLLFSGVFSFGALLLGQALVFGWRQMFEKPHNHWADR